MTVEQRFKQKYKIAVNDCWEWADSLDKDGYGQFWINNTNVRAHRFSYERLIR